MHSSSFNTGLVAEQIKSLVLKMEVSINRGTPIAGWFMSLKIPIKNGWSIGVPPWLRKPPSSENPRADVWGQHWEPRGQGTLPFLKYILKSARCSCLQHSILPLVYLSIYLSICIMFISMSACLCPRITIGVGLYSGRFVDLTLAGISRHICTLRLPPLSNEIWK